MKVILALPFCVFAHASLADGTPHLGVDCTFAAMLQPPLHALHVEVRAVPSKPGNFAWIEYDQTPLATVDAFHNPVTDLTTFVAPVTDGTIAMLSFVASGEAELTKHGRDQNGHVVWTTQIGHCDEVRG